MIDTKEFYDYLVSQNMDFFTGVPDSLLANICACIRENSPSDRNIITERLPRILKALDISRIIESRINEMDMNDTERIIHQVVDHELKAVIWFGALLGFIIGIVNVLF